MARRTKRPTLAQRGERADAAIRAGKGAVPAGIAAGALARTPIRVKAGGRSASFTGSNRTAAAVAAGTVAYKANKARRATAAKQGFRPAGYRGPVGRSRSPARRGGHHASRQRRDAYGRFA